MNFPTNPGIPPIPMSAPQQQPPVAQPQPTQQPQQPQPTQNFPVPPAPMQTITQEQIYAIIQMCIDQNYVPESLQAIKDGTIHLFQIAIDDCMALDILNQVKAKLQPQQMPFQVPQPPQVAPQPAQPTMQPQPPSSPLGTIPPIPGINVAIPPIPPQLQQTPPEEKPTNETAEFKQNVIDLLKQGQLEPTLESIETLFKNYGKRCGKITAQKVLDASGMAPQPIQQTGISQQAGISQMGYPAIPLTNPVQSNQPSQSVLLPATPTLFVDCGQSSPANATPEALDLLKPVIAQIEQLNGNVDYRSLENQKGVMDLCNWIKSNPTYFENDLIVRTSTLPRAVVATLRTVYAIIIDRIV